MSDLLYWVAVFAACLAIYRIGFWLMDKWDAWLDRVIGSSRKP